MPVIKFCERDGQSGEVIYSTPKDLKNLLFYIFRSDKTYSDTARKRNFGYRGPYGGCEPFYFPREYETDPDMIYEIMMFTINAFPSSHKISLVKHRIVSFSAALGLFPQDLDSLGRKIALFYASYGHTAAYSIHADKYNIHIHIAVNNISYLTGNQLNISFEYNGLMTICNGFESGILDDPDFQESRERILYGDLKYTADVGLSAREQIRTNSKTVRNFPF